MNSKAGFYWLAALAAGMFFFSSTPGALAQSGKIGYINSLRIRDEFKEFADAQNNFDKEVVDYQKKDQDMRRQLDSLMRVFESQSLLLSEAKKKEKQSEIDAKKEEYRKFFESIFGTDGELEKRNAEMTKPLLDKINAALERIAVQDDYAYIFDAVNANIAYAKPEYDLTDRVLEELRK
ncbi:MAG: OmpH family outer membrane protein [candidate division Zixibacteria bacterium]|nr:OmpH family outer membrane protein [candidate division Zixibacteria bacterium]